MSTLKPITTCCLTLAFALIAGESFAQERELGIASQQQVTAAIGSVSDHVGELGAEFGHAMLSNSKSRPMTVSPVYANVDDIHSDNPKDPTLIALKSAVALKRTIILESNRWDSGALEAVASEVLRMPISEDSSSLLFATWSKSGWSVSRSLSDLYTEMNVERHQIVDPDDFQTKALGGSTKLGGFLYDHAYATFQDTWNVSNSTQIYRPADEIFAIWKRNGSTGSCVVAWRGTSNTGEWVGDAVSQVLQVGYNLIPFESVRVGSYWRDRLFFRRNEIVTRLEQNGCKTGGQVYVTGHSLGGAMAIIFTYSLMKEAAWNVHTLVAFNPARVGNNSFVNSFNSLASQKALRMHAYCRAGDPVRILPIDLPTRNVYYTEQCTFPGAQFSTSNVKLNHGLTLWTQCASSTSC